MGDEKRWLMKGRGVLDIIPITDFRKFLRVALNRAGLMRVSRYTHEMCDPFRELGECHDNSERE